MTAEVTLREPAQEDDFRFALRSWVRCFSKSPYAGPYSRPRLSQVIRGTALDLLNRDSAVLTLATNPLDVNQIWGFICHEQGHDIPLVHFLYVKELFRGVGIGKRLLEHVLDGSQELRFTHKTRNARKFFHRCGVKASFAPALARFDPQEKN